MTHWQAGLDAITTELSGLSAFAEAFTSVNAAEFDRAVGLVLETSGRVVVSGMGKSGHIARKFAATLSSTGTPAQFIHPAEASHGDLGAITARDIVFLLSNSGESAELAAILAYTKRFSVPAVAITSNRDSNLARNAMLVLETPKAAEACPNGLAPTTSTTMQLVLCDAIAVALLKARKFKPADFRVYHPGGKLGASIRTVASLMISGASLPLVAEGTAMRMAILEMSAKGLGITGVTDAAGRLSGAITDGDLRRHIADAGLFELPVEKVMTPNPRTIAGDELVAVAAREMETHRITALFVVDAADKPLGIIRMAELLQAGLA